MTRGLLTCAVAIAGLALAGCGEEAEPGTLVGASGVDGPTQVVLIPTGKLAVTVTEPVDELPDGVAGPDDVADDGRWIGVATELRDGDARPLAALALERPPAKVPTIALVVDGRRYPIGPAGTDGYVAVAGDPEHAAVAVTYDGVTQTIDPVTLQLDAEPAAKGLYTLNTRRGRCGGCGVRRSVVVPYVGGLGWAKPGRAWAVVRMAKGGRVLVFDVPADTRWVRRRHVEQPPSASLSG